MSRNSEHNMITRGRSSPLSAVIVSSSFLPNSLPSSSSAVFPPFYYTTADVGAHTDVVGQKKKPRLLLVGVRYTSSPQSRLSTSSTFEQTRNALTFFAVRRWLSRHIKQSVCDRAKCYYHRWIKLS